MNQMCGQTLVGRRFFIGGSDARTVMGTDETALLLLWREKRSGVQPEDLSGNLIVQLGLVSGDINRRCYDLGHQGYPAVGTASGRPLDGGALDSLVEGSGAVIEAKFMLPWSFSEQAAAEKYMPQLQHYMWVVNSKGAVLSPQGSPSMRLSWRIRPEARHRLDWQPR
jgi:predicted phage-related endonuclease